jgi:two-component system OmpR family sensor kinase
VAARLSLRSRLILGVFALAAVGLVVADAATYISLRSFLLDRVDSSLNAVHPGVEQAVFREGEDHHGPGPLNATVPGDCIQVRRTNGTVVDGKCIAAFPGATAGPSPSYPDTISFPTRSNTPHGDRVRFLTVGAKGGGRYRVRASIERDAPGYVLLIAAPLHDVDSTLQRLVLVEVLVTALVLGAIALVGLWVVRLGLRPLTAIGETAAMIADGDLSQRIERDDERTEVGRLGRALNAMLHQIETAFRAREASEQKLRRFVADASHELRTPLSAVRAYAELFKRGAAARPEDLERSMRGIERESERMSVLVEDLLLLARLDEGRPLERKDVDLTQIVKESVETARMLEPGRAIRADLEQLSVTGDADRLRQVVDNLLANVRAHAGPNAAVDVMLRAADGPVRLEVADDGPGLEGAQLAHVFERFYRADSSRTRASGGSGLGLSIVAAVAEAHGGRVSAHPSPGGGATFAVELPRRSPPPQSAEPPSTS